MKISFAITRTETVNKNEVEMIRAFGQESYVERSEFVKAKVADDFEFLSDKSFEKDLFSLSTFLSDAESDGSVLTFAFQDEVVIEQSDEDRAKTLKGLLEVYRTMIADPDNNPQSVTEAAKRCVEKQMTFVESSDSILYDESTSDFVQRKDFAGLLKSIETDRASIVESDNTFRSKIVALARIGGKEIVKLNEKGTKWVFQTKSQMWNQLIALCEGTKLGNDNGKNLKNIILGSQPQFDDVYRTEGLDPSEPGDWTDVYIIGQSGNKVSSPMLDKDLIIEVVPTFRKIRKGEASEDEIAALGIEGKSNQKLAVNYLASISNAPKSLEQFDERIKELRKEKDEAETKMLEALKKKSDSIDALISNLETDKKKLAVKLELEAEKHEQERFEKEQTEIQKDIESSIKMLAAEEMMQNVDEDVLRRFAISTVAKQRNMTTETVQKALSA